MWHKMLGTGTKCNVYQFLVWPKKFGPAQNMLGPVEGQGFKKVPLMPCPSTGPKFFWAC
jgi:hypothetical protein